MKKIEKMAAKEFLKLSRKEQKRINSLKRIPTSPPGFKFEDERDKPRIKKWDYDDKIY